jgi:hypothetical protein
MVAGDDDDALVIASLALQIRDEVTETAVDPLQSRSVRAIEAGIVTIGRRGVALVARVDQVDVHRREERK